MSPSRWRPWLLSSALLFFGRRPAAASPELPVFTMARVDVGRDIVIATLDLSLGVDGRGVGDALIFFAFGAPGAPRALDVTLRFEGPSGIVEEPLTWTLATRSSSRALVASGPKDAAGIHVQLPEIAQKRATRFRPRFVLRFRAIHPLPTADEAGLREVRLRVTPDKGEAPALFRIDVQPQPGAPPLDRSLAFFCSNPKLSIATAEQRLLRAASPLLTPRPPGESLCVQFSQRVENGKK